MARSRTQADHYTKRAQREGYPARSVYKLEEIQRKFSLIAPGNHVLDIGASPGSWTLYAVRKLIGKSGAVVSVDLKPLGLNPIPKQVTFLQGDAFEPPVSPSVIELGPYDVIISDAAPSTTGNRTVDTARSEQLAYQLLQLAEEALKPGGSLVLKLFQGGGERDLLQQMGEVFDRAKSFKPKACRDNSFELFLIGTGYGGTTP